VYPPHVVARTITVASFIGGLDGIIDIVWVASSIMVLLVVLFALCSAIADLFPLPSYQKISLPIVVMVGIYSLYVFKNFIAEINFDQKVFPYMSLGVGMAIPLVCLLAAMIRGMRGTPLAKKESEGALASQ
jgi:predicted membrane channel-forming protein YqfA (hemolysin III family)